MSKHHVAVVLAAGYSKRYGSDKRLSGHDIPLAAQCISKVCNHYCQVIVVHRHDESSSFFASLKPLNIDFIPAPEKDVGLGTSIASAAKYILTNQAYKNVSKLSLFLADMPYLINTTVEALLASSKDNNIVRPSYLGQPGHPVIFGKNYFKQLTALEGDQGAKQVLMANKKNLLTISVKDKGCILDIDEPEHWLS